MDFHHCSACNRPYPVGAEHICQGSQTEVKKSFFDKALGVGFIAVCTFGVIFAAVVFTILASKIAKDGKFKDGDEVRFKLNGHNGVVVNTRSGDGITVRYSTTTMEIHSITVQEKDLELIQRPEKQ